MLRRRAVPLLLVLGTAFAPVALDACEAMCAARVAGVTGTSVGTHPCHHAGSTPVHTHASLSGGPHSCGHSDGLPSTSVAGGPAAPDAPTLLSSRFQLTPPASTRRAPVISTTPRDAIPISAPLPLRI